MALLSLSNISKNFGAEQLFKDISFNIESNHRIGLVGVNGCGKTTLFKIMQGSMDYDDGEIYKSKETNIGYVEQFICSDGKTVYEEALESFRELINIEEEMERLQAEIEKGNDIERNIIRKNNLEEKYSDIGGYTYKSITTSTLKGLGFKDEELELQVEKLSGGQKTKLMLVKLLLSKSNLLFLDEPTNNLDIDSAQWLENFLLNYKGSYIVISHDRYFLDKVTNETFELENKKLSIYKGNYSKYLQLKEEKNKSLSKKYEGTKKEISRIEGIIDQQKTWSQEKNYKIIRNKQKMIDRLKEGLEAPDSELDKLNFQFSAVAGGNQDVLIIKGLSKYFANRKLFENVSLDVHKKERVFIIGPNGCGKTTLINIIQSKLKQDTGDVSVGGNIKVGYYSQTQDDFNENRTILDFVWNKHIELNQTEVRKELAMFLFKGEDVNKSILDLSGGEKARLALLLVMLSKTNFLILDEPTNHLDINAREALEKALENYDGTLLIVSHDRYFINKLADKIYRLDEFGTTEFKGNYDYYLSKYIPKENVAIVENVSSNKIAYKEKKAAEALERKRKNRLIKVEEQITILEDKVKKLESELLNDKNSTNYEKAMELDLQIKETKELLDEFYNEWSELA